MGTTARYKMGIAGVGIVGGVLNDYFGKKGFPVYLYDLPKAVGSIRALNKADVVWIAVPTLRNYLDGSCDTSIVFEVVRELRGKKIIVIKSTVPPGTTDFLQERFPNHRFLHNPEFLTEIRATWDFYHPVHQILGVTNRSKDVALEIFSLLPRGGEIHRMMPASAAEMFKYTRNAFLAVKNSFFNQMFDLCEKLGVDYEFIKAAARDDPWIGPEHLEIWHNGKRGFNGKCLPKDTIALLKIAEKLKISLPTIHSAFYYNASLLAKQGIKLDS